MDFDEDEPESLEARFRSTTDQTFGQQEVEQHGHDEVGHEPDAVVGRVAVPAEKKPCKS